MENTEINTTQNETFTVNREIKMYLAEIAKWGNLLAIIGYVLMGLIALLSLVMFFAFSYFSEKAGFPMWIVGIVYLVLAGVYWFPVTYLYRFSAHIKLAIKQHNEQLYTSGFANLKSLFKFLGIFIIVFLVLYGVALVGFMVLQFFVHNSNV